MLDLVVMLIALVGNSCLGLFTLFKNPKSATNKLFFLFSLSIAIYIVFNYFAIHDGSTLIWVRAVMAVAVLINILFYLFVKTFPKPELSINKLAFSLSIVFSLLLLPLTFTKLVFQSVVKTNNGYETVPGMGMPLFLLHTFIFLGAGFIILIKKYRNSVGIEKIQIKLLLLGAIIMFVLIIIANLLLVVIFNITIFVGLLPLYTLIFVGFVSYAIVKHRFLDIRLIVARSVAYFFLISSLAIFYTSLLIALSTYITGIPVRLSTIAPGIGLTFLIALSFRPMELFIKKLTDKIFFRDKYDPNSFLHTVSEVLASTLDLHELSESIFKIFFHNMKVMSGGLILIKGHHKNVWSYGFRYEINQLREIDIHNLILAVENRANREHLLVFDELTESHEKKILRDHNINIVLPLIVKKDLIGIVLFGEKASGEIYSVEDIDLLKILTPEIAIAIRNSLSFDEIKRFNITLKEEVDNATERLRKVNRRLRQLDKLKDDFVSIASHELRTPMTAIKSYIWMALNKPPEPLHPELKNYLDISYKSTERLIHLVNDMLTVSRIERQKIELHVEKFNLYEILKAVYDELKITADEKHIHFTFSSPVSDLEIEGDKERLREIFQNLVGNALKFTPADGSITMTLLQVGDTYHASVADTGPGIPKDEMSKLFTKFGRIDYSYTNHANTPGTGLGLYISKQIASLHHGDIAVQSEVNKGTTFTVTLPIKQKENHADTSRA